MFMMMIMMMMMTFRVKVKAIPLQAWADPEISRSFRLPDFMTLGT
jgi:hypothetical protein